MGRIEFPPLLKKLLEDSELHAPIRALADRTGEILQDNKLDFFPYYTDHGIEHIQAVLKTEVELIPKSVWPQSTKESDPRLLCDADAAVIIGATLLHDLAMHLRPAGFRELIAIESRFQPLTWFRDSQEGHRPDRPWDELWTDYVREARKFSERDLTDIIGEKAAREWKFETLPEDPARWEENHRLIVGEFIRRHHARLAHEIAIYGFPGVPVGAGEHQFPALGNEPGHTLMRLADLIGLTARSHGTSMRVCQAYLRSSPVFQGTPRPMETAVLYPMALLRVADYLQIDRKRAPAILLQLRLPQSPLSVSEWDKHQAVQSIVPSTDPRGKMVTVSPRVSLPVYLQLQELIAGLQREIDHATAVLDESYGTYTELGLNQLNLSLRRVHSNLELPAFRNSLPYIPGRTGFSADPHLLTLLVKPLYGDNTSVGIRELMQNAIDAVCEREAWCENHGKSANSLELPKLEGDVQIDFIKRADGTWLLRVQDSGIGMTNDTLQNYFLRAGASFRRSSEWAKEFLDDKGQPRVLRSGRFGIGAFAVFLLGGSFKLWTRHITAGKSGGFHLEAFENSQLIELQRMDGLPIGTKIEMEIKAETAEKLKLEAKETYHDGPSHELSWYCLESPSLVVRILDQTGSVKILQSPYSAPLRRRPIPPEWSEIHPPGFERVCWTFNDAPLLSCNGITIGEVAGKSPQIRYPKHWELRAPRICVFDNEANLSLTTQRYDLLRPELPFTNELLRDIAFSFIAHALTCGPDSADRAFARMNRHPLSNDANTCRHLEEDFSGNLHWCATRDSFVPADPWLYSLLDRTLHVGIGVFGEKLMEIPSALNAVLELLRPFNCVLSTWESGDVHAQPVYTLNAVAHTGFTSLGHEIKECRIAISAPSPVIYSESWFYVSESIDARQHFQTKEGESVIPLWEIVRILEIELQREAVAFAAEIHTEPIRKAPESLIAKIWNECLGPRSIPFESAARRALIDHGRQHPELKRHIAMWEKMKGAGSKRATN